MLLILNQIFITFVCFNCFICFAFSLVIASPDGEYSNLPFSTTPGLYPNSSSVKYLYLSNSLDYNAEILAASRSKSY